MCAARDIDAPSSAGRHVGSRRPRTATGTRWRSASVQAKASSEASRRALRGQRCNCRPIKAAAITRRTRETYAPVRMKVYIAFEVTTKKCCGPLSKPSSAATIRLCFNETYVMRKNLDSGVLHAMRAFVCVVDAGSFSQAAEQVQLTTAQVSRLVSDLEKRLQAKLLQRNTRRQ